ncbi:MAG: ROK family protein [Dehalococcoidales bacterium]|nr:ROK family protein [Dehalococcoidales bacterium]
MPKTQKLRLPVLAVDLGGTNMRAGIISDTGKILAREYTLTRAGEGREAVINRLFTVIDHLLNLKTVRQPPIGAISIAAAGVIDTRQGIINASPNLPGWTDVPLRRLIEEKFKLKVFLLNDANAAALGEHRFGAGKGANNLIYVTVSTGIGGGIIIDGQLYSGSSGGAGEVGHMTIDINGPKCTCGNVGCLEVLSSGTAIAAETMRRISSGESSFLLKVVDSKIENITAEKVAMAAEQGDSLAVDVIATAAGYLGVGIVNLVNIFNPDLVIIGGGVSKIGDRLFNPVRQLVRARAFPLMALAAHILPARLGDDAGVIGAAVFAFEQGNR